jgi:diguanylate cyclase (GGDEF)-like protein
LSLLNIDVLKVDFPRHVLFLNVGVAALAAIGLIFLVSGPGLAVPLLAGGLAVTMLMVGRAPADWSSDSLELVALRDPETGLTTEEVAQEMLIREFCAAQRGRPLTVVMLRVEGLTSYGAKHSKAVAEQLLRVTARTIAGHRRGMHVAARHPGRPGTFLSILSGIDAEGGAVYAARLRREIMGIRTLPAAHGVSMGVASYDMSMGSHRDLVEKAAFALEKGAEAGGKVVVIGQEA